MKRIPVHCPACGAELTVRRLACDGCGTQIEGVFPLAVLGQLSDGEQDFILQFVQVSGSLKEMAKIVRLSYPTVRNRLNDIIERCKELQHKREGDSDGQ